MKKNYDRNMYKNPYPVFLTMEWLEQGRSPHPELYRCNGSPEECGIPIAEEGTNIDLRPCLDAIIAKSVFQDRQKWTYSASELAFILNEHAEAWGLTRTYSPATIGKYMKQLFNDPNQVRNPYGNLICLNHCNIERDTRRELKKSNDMGTQLQNFYSFYISWHPKDNSASSNESESNGIKLNY